MKYILFFVFIIAPGVGAAGQCDYPDDLDSAGRRCGRRAASVRPGGRLGGGDYDYTNVQKGKTLEQESEDEDMNNEDNQETENNSLIELNTY